MRIVAAVVAAAQCAQLVTAGTVGAYMNSAGYGKAVDSVTFGGLKNTASSVSMYYPCAAINPTDTFVCNAAFTAPVPGETPSTVYCQSKGAPNYIWSIQSYVTGGATADNPELEARLNIPPAECAAYTLESAATFGADGKSGLITVNATATFGAAIWLRGYEFLGTGTPESLDDLKQTGQLKWDLLIQGPFEYSTGNCTALTIPFVTQTGHENLYFVADGVAKSTEFKITCGPDVAFGCADAVVYPEAQVMGGCGNITVSYDPPADQLPAGITTVTATARDEAGNVAHCTFVADASAKGIPLNVQCKNVVYGCADAVVYPPAQVAGACGDFTVTYTPPADQLPDGVISWVTVSVRDNLGRTTECKFSADTTARGKPLAIVCPGNVVFGCADAAVYPPAQVSGGCGNVGVIYSPIAGDLPVGVATTVTVTATDQLGASTHCTFVATRESLSFVGFKSPINGVGGSCNQPLRTVNLGSVLPVKFDAFCSGLALLTGEPKMSIKRCATSAEILAGDFRLVGNEWNFVWNTTGTQKGVYELTATLQDQSTRTVFIRLK